LVSEPGVREPKISVGATEADAARNRAMGAGLVDDPYPLFHELVARCPVEHGSLLQHFPNPASRQFDGVVEDRTITAHAYDAGVEVLRQAEALSSEKFYSPALNAAIGKSVIGMDEPEHRRMRLLLQTAFSKAKMERWKGSIIQPVVDEHLLRVRPLGRADLYAEVAVNVPVQTIGVALGLPPEDRQQFFDWAVGMTSGTEIMANSAAVAAYVEPLIAERRERPTNDLLSILVNARIEDMEGVAGGDTRSLTDEEINIFVRLLIIAGAGTTYRAYGNLMFLLLSHPEQLAAVRDDRGLVPATIEESLRVEQPLAWVQRIAVAATSVDGVEIAPGCPVTVNVGAANHDTTEWGDDADAFNVRRDRSDRHLSFGFGIHRCLGIHLARGELHVLLNRTLDLLPNLRFDPDESAPHITGLTFRMPTAVPAVWDV
jgi:cytochrome P450